jgi:hypothetical protein
VAQIGQAQGNHVTPYGGKSTPYTGERLHNDRTFQPTEFGNAIAARTVCGPGGSREVMASGSQGQHGSAAPGNAPAKSTDILRQFGPDISRK